MSRRAKFGLLLPIWDSDPNCTAKNETGGTPITWEGVADIAKLCDELGYYSVNVADHLFRGLKGNILEPWTILSAVAALTYKIRLGQFVMCNGFRHPSALAKMACTLDVVSKGRLELGLGTGWMEDEFVQHGIPWSTSRVRTEQLQESIEVLKKLFTEDRATYSGKYYKLSKAICEPKPVQKPHPPIWVGGEGERYLLRVVAQAGDGCNFGGSPEAYSKKLQMLRIHCESIGRDFSTINKSWVGVVIVGNSESEVSRRVGELKPIALKEHKYRSKHIVGTPSQCVQKIEQFLSIGVEYFVIHGTARMNDGEVRLFARDVMHSF